MNAVASISPTPFVPDEDTRLARGGQCTRCAAHTPNSDASFHAKRTKTFPIVSGVRADSHLNWLVVQQSPRYQRICVCVCVQMRTRDILSSHSSSIYLSFFCLLFADHFPLTPFNFHLTARERGFFFSFSTEINWKLSARNSCGLSFEQEIYRSLAYAAKQWGERRTIAVENTQAKSDVKTVWRICVNSTHFFGIFARTL